MSFNDLNDLEAQPAGFANDTSLASPEFTKLTRSISQSIFQITSNVSLIHRHIGLLRTPRDTEKMRNSLMDALAKTKDLSKSVVPQIRELNRWNADEIGPSEKYEQQKLTGDFQKAVTDFQNAQKLALEKQKDYVKEARQTMEEEEQGEAYEPDPDGRGERPRQGRGVASSQIQDQQRVHLLDNSEIAFNEQLIEERETEIQGIEQGIVELNEIFRDLGTIVTEQGYLLDNIEENVARTAQQTRQANKELTQANRYQKNARKRACYLMLILCVILTIVLLAVITPFAF